MEDPNKQRLFELRKQFWAAHALRTCKPGEHDRAAAFMAVNNLYRVTRPGTYGATHHIAATEMAQRIDHIKALPDNDLVIVTGNMSEVKAAVVVCRGAFDGWEVKAANVHGAQMAYRDAIYAERTLINSMGEGKAEVREREKAQILLEYIKAVGLLITFSHMAFAVDPPEEFIADSSPKQAFRLDHGEAFAPIWGDA